MLKSISVRYRSQSKGLNVGDRVYYVGLDTKIQRDYGNQELVILRVDSFSKIAVCKNNLGDYLVGVPFSDLQFFKGI